MLEAVDGLAANCPMSLSEALKMHISFEALYYESEAWTSRKKIFKEEQEQHNNFIKLGNAIIKGLSNIAAKA